MKRADLRARIERSTSSTGRPQYHLTIENHGSARAHTIGIAADGQPVEDHPTVLSSRAGPLEHLGPGATFRYLLAATIGTPHPREIRIEWQDDSGDPGSYETQLS